MGSNLLEEREACIPTAAELIRLVQLIRHQRPDLLDFVRSLVIRSPLATVAASVAPPLVTEDEQPRSRNQVIDMNEQENETIHSCCIARKHQNNNVPPNNVPPNNVAPNTEFTFTVPIRSPR